MPKHKFNCGCELESTNGKNVILDLNPDHLRLDCPGVWSMLAKGLSKGVFQLESNLGRHWVKVLKPVSVDQLGALTALIRPGVLEAKNEKGKSMTQLYCDRKNGTEPIVYEHPALEPILKDDYGILVFQEAAIKIAKAIGGFSLQKADDLRKAMGKKDAELMAKVREQFLAGCKEMEIVDDETAKQIFDNVQKSQRYAFNRAHSMEYGLLAYATAYCKFHFPLRFFCSYLQEADSSLDPKTEVYELVNDARLFDIEVTTTDFKDLKDQFYIVGKSIKFGIVDTEGVGQSVFHAIVDKCNAAEEKLGKRLAELSWLELLLFVLTDVNRTAVINLIEVGAFDYLGLSRTLMTYEYGMIEKLTKKEIEFLRTAKYTPTLVEALKQLGEPKVKTKVKILVDGKQKLRTVSKGGGCANVKREAAVRDMINLLENPPYSLKDSLDWIAWTEEKKLGVAITSHKTDSCDLGRVTCSCKEFLAGFDGYIVVGVSIKSVREVKTKRGKNPGQDMAMLVVGDGTCQLESVVCFPDDWAEYSNLLTEGNVVAIRGERTPTGSLAVKKVWQL
jgi:DNA polymerase III alpha subunit